MLLHLLQTEGTNIVSEGSLSSPRAIGDAVQDFLAESPRLAAMLQPLGMKLDGESTRRSMQDLALIDDEGNYFAIDVKTHNLDTKFNMPNLTSVKRLAKFYDKGDDNYFCILLVSYRVTDRGISYQECLLRPIEELSWDCLTLGNLGWGQIQILNANRIILNTEPRAQWMVEMCNRLDAFYDAEIDKINGRKQWFEPIREHWQQRIKDSQE